MQDLILLHGALGDSTTLKPLAQALGSDFTLHCPDFEGHGARSGEETDFSISAFQRGLGAFIADRGLSKPAVFGYSMGGYVAAALESVQPGTIGALCTLATKWRWSEEIAAREVKMLRPNVILEKAPKFAAALASRHGDPAWKTVMDKTAVMMTGMGAAPPLTTAALSALQLPVLVCLGDSDKMVSIDETLEARNAIPNASLCVLPATPHPLELAPVPLLAQIIRRFLGR